MAAAHSRPVLQSGSPNLEPRGGAYRAGQCRRRTLTCEVTGGAGAAMLGAGELEGRLVTHHYDRALRPAAPSGIPARS